MIKPRRFEMGVRLAERATGIQAEMSLWEAIIPSSQTPFKKLISSCLVNTGSKTFSPNLFFELSDYVFRSDRFCRRHKDSSSKGKLMASGSLGRIICWACCVSSLTKMGAPKFVVRKKWPLGS
jgi:hypothetical protein